MQVELSEFNFWHGAEFKSGWPLRVGSDQAQAWVCQNISSQFQACIENVFITLKSNDFFLRDVDLLCSPQ